MGKKGNWFTALKKAFSSSPKEKPTNVHQLVPQFPSSHGHAREKKRWSGFGRSSRAHAEPTSPAAGALINIPLYREPSSIEKILGDAEMDQQRQYYATATTRAQYQITPARPAAASAAAPLPQPPVATEREKREEKPAAVVLPLPPPSPPPLIRRFDHDREQQQKLQHLQLQQQQSRAETEWRQQQQQPRRHRAAARQRAPPPDRARAAAVAIQAAFRGYMASAAELPVAAGADPAAGRDAGGERAAADGAGDAVHADAGARAGAGACQPRGGHGAAQPAAAPRRHAQGRRPVARRMAGRRHLGRQPVDAGGGRRPDQAQGGGRHQARESPCLRLLASAAEGDADGGPRDPGGPAVGPEPMVVDAHRPRPRAGGVHPRRSRHQAPAAGSRLRPARGDDDADGDDNGGDDAGAVGGLGLLDEAEGLREAGQEGTPDGVEHPRRREPDELPGVRRRRAQLHDADAVGVRQGAGAGAAAAAAAAAAGEGGPGEAQVLVRARTEHRELGQEPVLEGRRAAVVAGGHAGGVGGRWEAPAHEVHQRAQRRLHGVHAGRDRQEALQVD